jgi:hypothetical protein
MKVRPFATILLMLMSGTEARAQSIYPPQTKNAALRYWMAFAEMQDPPAEKVTQDLLEKTIAGEAPWNEKTLGPLLDANGSAIGMMQRGTKLPECDWGLEYNQGPRASIAYAPRARVLSRLNTLQGIREMANGNSQAAVDTWLAGVQFSEHLANGGSLIFVLIAKSALMPNLRALTFEATHGHLTGSQKSEISAKLKGMREDGFNWAAAWGFEESAGEQSLDEIRNAKNPRAEYELLIGSPIPGGASIPTSSDVQNYRTYMRAVQAALDLPPAASEARISRLESQKLALEVVAQQIIPNAQKENGARSEVFAARKQLLEAVALR